MEIDYKITVRSRRVSHHIHFLNYNLRAVQLLQISHYHLLDVDEDTGVWIERSAGKLTALGILKQVQPY